jgi:hypothetical protein
LIPLECQRGLYFGVPPLGSCLRSLARCPGRAGGVEGSDGPDDDGERPDNELGDRHASESRACRFEPTASEHPPRNLGRNGERRQAET